jgi:tetratricopeptide (TPR) repeat protein
MDYRTSHCAACGTIAPKLKKCPCGTAQYCGSECQKKDWPTHKDKCTEYLTTKTKKAKATHGRESMEFIIALFLLGKQFFENQQWMKAENVLLKCRDKCHLLELDKSSNYNHKKIVIAVIHYLGLNYRHQHAHQLARTTCEEALVLARQLPGIDNVCNGIKISDAIISDIELIDAMLIGNGADVTLFQKRIQECTVSDGIDAGILYHDLCACHGNRGEFDLAMDAAFKTLTIQRQLGDQKGIGSILKYIAMILHDTGKPDEALPYMEEALPILRATFGNKSHIVADAIVQNGQINESLGKYDGVTKMYRKALRNTRRVVGDDHPNVRYIMKTLCDSHITQGQFSEVLALMEKEESLMRSVMLEKFDTTRAVFRKHCSENE